MDHTPHAPKPRDDQIDVFGLTHPGRVRQDNQDNFLIASIARDVRVLGTSLSNAQAIAAESTRLAFLAMVADGVGGGPDGEKASRLTVEHATRYVTHSVRALYASNPQDDIAVRASLEEAARRCHEDIRKMSEADPTVRGMATTLTLWIGLWPTSYLLQVGDSRCYLLKDGVLHQISRDQTMAQDLVDRGALTKTDAHRTPLANVLSSSIGGSQTAPVITRFDQEWGNVGLLCSDGLTKHVSDEKIKERLVTMTSARQACEALLRDALDGGGTDNITVLVGRAVQG